MDEIDAALDFKNVSIVANYIKVLLDAKRKKACVSVSVCALLCLVLNRVLTLFQTRVRWLPTPGLTGANQERTVCHHQPQEQHV